VEPADAPDQAKRHTREKVWERHVGRARPIPARQLRTIARECIERHVDRQQLEFLRAAEKSERELLTVSRDISRKREARMDQLHRRRMTDGTTGDLAALR
jgi:hypothetical protein